MGMQFGRYVAERPPGVAEGWTLERITPVSRLYGANGIRTGADGRIYVAQVSGSQISAIDPETGAVEAIAPMGGGIVGPDDLVFDDEGNLYATEITEGRVSVLETNGRTRVVYGDIPVANPITFHQGRLIAGELRMGGRILELDRNGGEPKVLASDIPMVNAFDVGPDGMLYFPAQAANEIWRVSLDGKGVPEKVVGDLGVPDSVKFDSKGRIVSTQVHSGQVLRIDPRTGAREVLADIFPGLDNVAFIGDRIFISSIPGYVHEILEGGKLRDVIPGGFNWPLGMAMGADGVLFVADGPFSYNLKPGGAPQIAGMLFTPGSPGYVRGVAAAGPGEFVVTIATGQVSRWRPAQQESEVLADGFDRLYGVAIAPGGGVVFAEAGGGRVLSVEGGKVETLASGLKEPSGVAVGSDGVVYVAESHGGRVAKLSGGKAETVVDGLTTPQGLLVLGGRLYVVDAGARALVEYDLTSGSRQTVAANLPVGAPPGVTPKFLGAIGDMSGPMGAFAGVTAGADGTLYVSGDAEGSVLAVKRA
jgi:sugar lactone lactonase YvrE